MSFDCDNDSEDSLMPSNIKCLHSKFDKVNTTYHMYKTWQEGFQAVPLVSDYHVN